MSHRTTARCLVLVKDGPSEMLVVPGSGGEMWFRVYRVRVRPLKLGELGTTNRNRGSRPFTL